jgi:DNA-binding NtrC family response regulator
MPQVTSALPVTDWDWEEITVTESDPVVERFHTIVGASPCMKDLYRQIEQAGPSSAAVLIVGETGTGKELVARTLHQLSGRRAKPYIAVNCAAIPENLVEGELFGHEKGAYTGALSRTAGYFEQANRGTLFLDEISAMPVSQQVKLLRVLQEGRLRRLGGTTEIEAEARVIAAMNVDPEEAMADGRLRTDLYYRLSVFVIRVPPLRERPGDVLLLSRHFATEFARAQTSQAFPERRAIGFDPAAARALTQYSWPGNVRELRNAIERAVILAKNDAIRVEDLPASVTEGSFSTRLDPVDGHQAPVTPAPPLPQDGVMGGPGMTLEELKRRLILATLEATDNNISEAARQLGISARTIYNKIREWNLSPRDLGRRPLATREIVAG